MPSRSRSQERLQAELARTKAERGRLAAAVAAYRREVDHWRHRLREREAHDALNADFRAAFRASPHVLLLLTPDWRMVEVSDARLKATMTRREDTLGRHLFEVFPDNPDNEDAVGQTNLRASLARVLETKQPHEMALQRYDLACPDGTFEERYWRPLNVPVLGPDGEVRYLLHCVEDVTAEVRLDANEASRHEEQERARQAQAGLSERLMVKVAELEAAQATLKGVLDSAVSGIAVLESVRNEQGRIVDFVVKLLNPAGERLLGVSHQALGGLTLLARWPGQVATGLFDMYVHVAETGLAGEKEVHYDLDGHDFWLSMSVAKVGDGVAVTFTDITDRQEAAMRIARQVDELRQADQLKDQFLGILSHELRTPINAIMGFGSILADGVAEDLKPQQRAYVEKILDASDTLLGLVDDLLDMSRVQAGRFALERRTVEVASLIRNTLGGLAIDAIQKGQSLINAVPMDLPPLQADPRRVSQVLANLVTNAIKYTPDGGFITVRACVLGDAIRIEVSDTGSGVSPEHQGRIFEAFTQVDMSNTRAKGGVGLGLSIVKALVEAHGGEVGVESQGDGTGSTFYFTLPMESA